MPRGSTSHILQGRKTLSKYVHHGYWRPNQITLRDAQGNERHESQRDYGWKLYINNPLADDTPPEYVKVCRETSSSVTTAYPGNRYGHFLIGQIHGPLLTTPPTIGILVVFATVSLPSQAAGTSYCNSSATASNPSGIKAGIRRDTCIQCAQTSSSRVSVALHRTLWMALTLGALCDTFFDHGLLWLRTQLFRAA